MILCIDQVLTSEELESIHDSLAKATFVDGKLTAGWHAKLVKENQQLSRKDAVAKSVKETVTQGLHRSQLFRMAVKPKNIRSPLISRYEEGMSYGTHVDNALMGQGNDLMRSDVSFTLFLNSPEDYDGGELVIETSQGEQSFKLNAGAMITYPSTTLHRVEPVTKGVRLVAVSWVQSLIRDPNEREILFDLETTRQAIFNKYGKTQEFDLVAKSCANLLRKWTEV
ncbi:2OG-Fe(II) oxygenase [Halothece sp. PCC 7418]|uniref:Fe2+-dependent dioxygenase n=1 Tax=Halothece sp. (strain PCC 7418) TaxID=65093 RepID=UPI0002A070FF|nr:Fe2+-dependent dioxygenase [Halothece sp. PCC 7418]AFZ45367.1 2OG-Fe(II) oxygenase [Halothece sp. PCC 7418]